jgi:signal transduction histidine kinase
MTLQTEAIRAEPHGEIGSLIEANAEALLERWCHRALEEEPMAKRVHMEVLRDHLAKFLRTIGAALRESGDGDGRHKRRAFEHGEQRWEAGWSLTELVRDYQLLRLVLLEFLEHSLSRPLAYRETMAISVFVDDAIAVSTKAYVAQQEEEAIRVATEKGKALEDMNRRKDEFMAILGHELRNPLAPILTSVRVLRAVLQSAPEEATSCLDVIDRQSRHLVRLVDDLLDLAKISRGELSLRKTRINLINVVEQAAETIDSMMKARKHEFTVTLPAAPMEIDGDPDRLLQVVGNLLNNACKYTPTGGRIALEAAREDGIAMIRVRDNGVGIPEDMRLRVFDMFMQVEDSKRLAQGGLGLGLTLVQRLVQQHGGTVVCTSGEAGAGSEFVVRLPLVGHAVPGATAPSLRIVKADAKRTTE